MVKRLNLGRRHDESTTTSCVECIHLRADWSRTYVWTHQ